MLCKLCIDANHWLIDHDLCDLANRDLSYIDCLKFVPKGKFSVVSVPLCMFIVNSGKDLLNRLCSSELSDNCIAIEMSKRMCLDNPFDCPKSVDAF